MPRSGSGLEVDVRVGERAGLGEDRNCNTSVGRRTELGERGEPERRFGLGRREAGGLSDLRGVGRERATRKRGCR